MSWSFLDRPLARRPLYLVGGGVLCATLATPALAAEYYWQPSASVVVESESNLDLDPGVKQWQEGYILNAASIFGIATPDWNTILRPRVQYAYYPQDEGDDRVEAYLDLNSVYRTQRSTATLTGSIYRQDDLNSEYTSPIFNDINPGQPITGAGVTTVGTAVDSVILYPKYVYNFTPLLGAGANVEYQAVRYSPADDSSHVNFNYYLARPFVTWTVSPRTNLTFGALGSQYSATEFTARDTGTGATVGFETNWTPLLTTTGTVIYEHATFNQVLPTPFDATVNAWGANFNLVYKQEASQMRVYAGRAISPTGGGALYNVDKIQVQYDRNLTARLSVTGALVGLRTEALTSTAIASDRKYANALVEAHWFVTRTFFLQGGYQYSWQKYETDLNSVGDGAAVNNRFYLQFGYQGLGQQR